MSWTTPDAVKVELSKTDSAQTGDDDAIQAKIDAACAEIEDRVGHVDLAAYVETHTVGCDGQVILDERPVSRVDSIRVLAADGSVLQDLGAGTDPDPSGVLWNLPRGTVQIAYLAGRNPIPANFTEAAVQLSAHLWRQSRSLTEGGRIRPETVIGPGMASALPNKVADLLGLSGNARRSRVFVG